MIDSDHVLARTLAVEAGRLLLGLRRESAALTEKERGRAGDHASHDLLLERLAARRPGDAVLSEEGQDDQARLAARRVWIIDPLDGTREYSELGRDDWAVHVALWQDGKLAAGAVALPARSVVYATGQPPSVSQAQYVAGDPIMVAVSRTRPPALLGRLAAELPLELVPMGSAGVKTMAVLAREADVYLHGGGQYEWDSAAPVAVATAAGAHASRLDGSPLRYNQPDPLLPDLLVCRPALRDPLLGALKRIA